MASERETIFTMEATPVKYGAGASSDAGWELKRLGVSRRDAAPTPALPRSGTPSRSRA